MTREIMFKQLLLVISMFGLTLSAPCEMTSACLCMFSDGSYINLHSYYNYYNADIISAEMYPLTVLNASTSDENEFYFQPCIQFGDMTDTVLPQYEDADACYNSWLCQKTADAETASYIYSDLGGGRADKPFAVMTSSGETPSTDGDIVAFHYSGDNRTALLRLTCTEVVGLSMTAAERPQEIFDPWVSTERTPLYVFDLSGTAACQQPMPAMPIRPEVTTKPTGGGGGDDVDHFVRNQIIIAVITAVIVVTVYFLSCVTIAFAKGRRGAAVLPCHDCCRVAQITTENYANMEGFEDSIDNRNNNY